MTWINRMKIESMDRFGLNEEEVSILCCSLGVERNLWPINLCGDL